MVPCTRKRGRPSSARLLFEQPDELLSDDAALPLRLGDPAQRLDEFGLGFDRDKLGMHPAPEGGRDLLRFALTEQARIDEDRHELISHGLVYQRRGHGSNPPRR